MKVESIGEVVVVIHDSVKRRFSEVRYLPKLRGTSSHRVDWKLRDILLRLVVGP